MKGDKKKILSIEYGSKSKMIVYIIIRALVIGVMIAQILNKNWDNVFICGLTLILLLLPSLLSYQLKIVLPNTLEIIIVCFIFAAEILGEVQEYYVIFEGWDDMLHTMNGFLAAAVGFAMIDVLNEHERVSMTLSPAFVAVVAFCFSMTIGVLWEFFEFSMDYFFGKDMQKDTWISAFHSVALNPEGANVPVDMNVESVTVNGQRWEQYLDIGLYDTMKDLFVNFVGAVVFSVFGLIYIKNRGRGFAARFIPRLREDKKKEG